MSPASLLAPSTPSGPRCQPRPAKLPASCAAMTGAAVALTAPLKWHSPPGMAATGPSFERNLSSPSATVPPPVHGPWPLSARPSLTCQHCTVPVRPCSTLACTPSPRHQPPAAHLPPCCAGSQPRRVLSIVGPPSCPCIASLLNGRCSIGQSPFALLRGSTPAGPLSTPPRHPKGRPPELTALQLHTEASSTSALSFHAPNFCRCVRFPPCPWPKLGPRTGPAHS